MALPNFIIGGTNKAGTTSVFRYLSEHPEVCGSNVKETGFFVSGYSGSRTRDLEELEKYFSHCESKKVVLEASTGYLALGEKVIPRMKEILPSLKMLFILRHPVDRIYSYYNFHAARLSIPNNISFEKYLEYCLRYERNELTEEDIPFDPWHINALSFGKYYLYLQKYLDEFEPNAIKVMYFDDLTKDPRSFMKEVSAFAGISERFFDEYRFQKSNVTFSSKSKLIHKLAICINHSMEKYLRQRPILKSRLVKIYKLFNMAGQGYKLMDEGTRSQLLEYYAESNAVLKGMVKNDLPEGWYK